MYKREREGEFNAPMKIFKIDENIEDRKIELIII